ncbi:hypothetical protein V8E36_002441 [Tilletia maclaganii]
MHLSISWIQAAGMLALAVSTHAQQVASQAAPPPTISKAGPAAEERCRWLGTNFAAHSSQPINNTFTEYYPEGSNPSLELLVARYPAGTLPATFLPNLTKTLSEVGPDVDLTADAGYGKLKGRTSQYGPLGSLPAFCRFSGNLPTSKLTAVLFEVWLPLASDESIPLAPLNASDYPTDSTPVVLAKDGTIVKGPPYLLKLQADGSLPPVGSSDATASVIPDPKPTTDGPAAPATPPVTPSAPLSQPQGPLLPPTHSSGNEHSRRAHRKSRSADMEDRTLEAPVLCGDQVFGQAESHDGWNGRLLYIGNGGQRGFVPLTDLKQAMARHRFAVAGSNAGHFSPGSGTTWALGPQVEDTTRDWSSRAVHVARQASLEVLDLFYGSAAGERVRGETSASKFSKDRLRTYYSGCSVGGMQGWGSIQNYPEDFDALLVGAPAIYFNAVNHGQIHTQKLSRKAVSGAGTLRNATLGSSVRKLVLEQCDGLDGLKDGVLTAAYQCQPDFAPLLCGSKSTYGQDPAQCLTAPQLENLKELYRPTTYDGTFIYDRYLPGLEIQASSLNGTATKAVGWISNAIYQGQLPSTFDGYANQSLETYRRGEAFNPGGSNTDKRDITAFLQGGKRKIIHYHGLGDLTISPAASIRYHDEVGAVSHPSSGSLSDSYRLFSIPGMAHCRNGPGPWLFGASTQNDAGNTPLQWDTRHDVILSMVAWAEKGKLFAPSFQVGALYNEVSRKIPEKDASPTSGLNTTFVSRAYGLKFTRKLCPWPKIGMYKGGPTTGPTAWKSFACRQP